MMTKIQEMISRLSPSSSNGQIEAYIATFPDEIQIRLRMMREVFLNELPHVEECIRHNMPSYTVGKHHLYFAGYKSHIGMYPIYNIPEIENEILLYRGKGTSDALHFPHSKPLPILFIRRIIQLKNRE